MEVNFVDTTMRDGSQSLWASGMRSGMMEAVAPDLNRAGFKAVEVPLGALHFKKMVRDLKEDPWDLVRMLARALGGVTKASIMGQSIHPFEAPSPPSLMQLFFRRLTELGALDRVQLIANTSNQSQEAFPWMVPYLKSLGLQISVALSYTISPRHTDEYYAQKTREIAAFRPDVIYLKDQGGLLTVDRIRTLIPAILQNAGDIDVELHSHCTTGLAEVVYVEALGLGVSTLHTGVPPLANGSAQPSIFAVAQNARLLGHTTPVDTQGLVPASERLTAIAKLEGLPIGAPLEYDHAQYIHQVPGGVISNLRHQLAELRLQDRLDEVLEEAVAVRRELGYPIMITPYSQFVVSQAAINVALGERYKVVIDELIQFARGVFGEDSGFTVMDENLKDRLLSMPRAKELGDRKAEDATLQELRDRIVGPGASDEEFLLLYIMKGEGEIRAMRAAGPPRQYFSAATPLLNLLPALEKTSRLRYVRVQKGSDTIRVSRAE